MVIKFHGKYKQWELDGDFSDKSIVREFTVFEEPRLNAEIKNQNNLPVDEINGYPFYISFNTRPMEQKPISYSILIRSKTSYKNISTEGNIREVGIDDIVYNKVVDGLNDMWNVLLEITPGKILLQNNCKYELTIIANMDSGLSATYKKEFYAYFNENYYTITADINVDKDTLEATIEPKCYEEYVDNGVNKKRIVKDCLVSVYRISYDGSLIPIIENIEDIESTSITDPHPSLDYARYRIVAKSKKNGTISYADITDTHVGVNSIVIQWAERWIPFRSEDNIDSSDDVLDRTKRWSGSLLYLPYNISTTENRKIESVASNYLGRSYPVYNYGTMINDTISWSTKIPNEDKELLYGLRKLSKWDNTVYIREGSGLGYWADVTVNISRPHKQLTTDVSIEVKRVDGGI